MAKLKSKSAQENKGGLPTSKTIHTNAIQWWHIAGFTLLYLFVCYWIYNPDFTDLNGDNFAYYLLGKGLAEGKGYVNATSITPSPQIHFPPGFPFIIAVFVKFFGAGMDGVATGMTVFYLLSLILFYLAMNRIQSSKALSFVVTVFLILNNLLIGSALSCMSEIPFVLSSAAGIFFLTKSKDDFSKIRWSIILVALFFAVGYYIKTIGIGLFGALFFISTFL
jgi:4-amino-4-deoxy-L-arabinose transferase-like glycosyltransferase